MPHISRYCQPFSNGIIICLLLLIIVIIVIIVIWPRSRNISNPSVRPINLISASTPTASTIFAPVKKEESIQKSFTRCENEYGAGNCSLQMGVVVANTV